MYKVKYIDKDGNNRILPFHIRADAVDFRNTLSEAGIKSELTQDECDGRSVMTVSEVAKEIGCNKGYAYKLINIGLLPSIRLGSTKVLRDSLHKFLTEYEGQNVDEIIKEREAVRQ